MFIKHLREHLHVYILAVFSSFLYFYHLGHAPLGSWDEAWYGSIAREIVRTSDIIFLMWNGVPYYDHPPMGFWLIALSYKLFGISEFSTRLPSAVLGVATTVLMYGVGYLLSKKKAVGFASALILGTSVWYVIRVRSGNLDAMFVFFFVLTVFCALKSVTNFKWFYGTMLSFAALLLTKTLVGAAVLPLISFINFKQFFNLKKNGVRVALGILMFLLLFLSWYAANHYIYAEFLKRNIVDIGTRDKSLVSYANLHLQQPLFYIHMGMRKWYYLWFLSVGFIVMSLRFLKKNISFLLLWNIIVLYPFLTSEKTELWHLIPVYIPIALIIAYGLHELKDFVTTFFKQQKLFTFLYYLFFLTIAVWQVKVFYNEVIPQDRYTTDDVAIMRHAANYGKRIMLDDDFVPVAVFYSGKPVIQLSYYAPDKNTLKKLFQSKEENFVVVTRNWAVDELGKENIPYKLVEKNNTYSILER